jgi:hypothetical protein
LRLGDEIARLGPHRFKVRKSCAEQVTSFQEAGKMRLEVWRWMRIPRLTTAGIAVVGVLLFLGSPSAARADDLAYMSTGSDLFGTIDLDTGLFTELGDMGQLLSGLGVTDGNIYGGVEGSQDLYQVNLTNGSLTLIGAGTLSGYNDFGSTLSGLYAVSTDQQDLYQVDPSTGATTLIGATGFNSSCAVIGMSTGSSALYFSCDDNLYTLSTTTGAATLIGSMGIGGGSVGALVTEDSALWAGANPGNTLDTVNPTTGAATFAANVTGGDSGSFWGLTPDPGSVPEPGSAALFLTTLPPLVFVLRKRIFHGL